MYVCMYDSYAYTLQRVWTPVWFIRVRSTKISRRDLLFRREIRSLWLRRIHKCGIMLLLTFYFNIFNPLCSK